METSRVLEDASLSKAAGSLLSQLIRSVILLRILWAIGSRESKNQVEASLAR